MTARLEVRRLKLHHTREAESLRQHNELLQQMVLNLRKKLGMTGDDTGVARPRPATCALPRRGAMRRALPDRGRAT